MSDNKPKPKPKPLSKPAPVNKAANTNAKSGYRFLTPNASKKKK